METKTKEQRRAFWMLLIAFGLLIIVGTVNVFSATFVEDMAVGGNAYGHLIRQGVYIVIGVIPATCRNRPLWK